MTEETTPHGLHRRSLLLGGAGFGAGIVTSAALVDVPAAAAGTTTRIHFEGRFTHPKTPDWHYLPFRVPHGVQAIEVRYDYKSHDTGVGYSTNVVDLGIFDPSGKGLGNADGFRGWSGGARRHVRLTRRWATPGYLAGPITAGRWHVILGPFLITPPGTPWHVTVSLEHGAPLQPAFHARHAPTSVPGTPPGWYRGDLHTHSVHSDGRWTPAQLVEQAQANGLDFLGTSDHNTNAATRVFGHHVPEGFLVVSGEEVTTRNGHWLATGTTPGTWVDWRYRAADHRLGRFTDLTRSRCGVAIAAHPFVPVAGTRWDFGPTYAEMDAVEVWNGPWELWDQKALAAWHDRLLAGHFTPAVGNSDSHHEGQVVGLPQTVYRLDTLSSEAVVAAVQGGHCWIAESSQVDLTFEGHGTITTSHTGECGDTVPLADGEELACHLDVKGVPGTVAQLIGNGGVLAAAVADGDGHLVLDASVTSGFVRAEVRRATTPADPTGDLSFLPMVALTNPIFAGAGPVAGRPIAAG
jgi:predicted metal-dependent phosphoesterase TrpH